MIDEDILQLVGELLLRRKLTFTGCLQSADSSAYLSQKLLAVSLVPLGVSSVNDQQLLRKEAVLYRLFTGFISKEENTWNYKVIYTASLTLRTPFLHVFHVATHCVMTKCEWSSLREWRRLFVNRCRFPFQRVFWF